MAVLLLCLLYILSSLLHSKIQVKKFHLTVTSYLGGVLYKPFTVGEMQKEKRNAFMPTGSPLSKGWVGFLLRKIYLRLKAKAFFLSWAGYAHSCCNHLAGCGLSVGVAENREEKVQKIHRGAERCHLPYSSCGATDSQSSCTDES